MHGTEYRAALNFNQLQETIVQRPFRGIWAPAEREAIALPPRAESLRLRQDVISLEHWLDLNA